MDTIASDPTAAVLAAFPSRPLSVRSPQRAWKSWLFWLVLIAMLGYGIVHFAGEVGPDLVSDFEVRETAQPLRNARMEEGRCRSNLVMLHSCTLTLVQRVKDGELRREVHFLFTEPHFGSFEVAVMGDPMRPETLTTDLGLDRLWNRAITLAVAGAFCVLFLFGALMMLWVGRRERARVRSMSGQPLQPSAVSLEAKGPYWWVKDAAGARHRWSLAGKARPFVIDPGKGLVLAVAGPGMPPFPLDDALQWVDLTDAERTALWQARENMVQRQGLPLG